MEYEIIVVEEKEKDKLNNLMQLYLHELSYFFKCPFNSKICKYEYDVSKYFQNNIAYFIKNNDDIVGFVLVDKDKKEYEISEIFVLNNYKRNGFGSNAVKQIFNLYRGDWAIKVVPNSEKAEKFWYNIISKYTNNNFELLHTGKYNRAEFYFSNEDIK